MKTRKYLTPYQIAEQTDSKDGIANIRAINKLFRAQDESNLYPVNNRFNVTERAICKMRRCDCQVYGIEYCLALDGLISKIVNNIN